MNEDMFHLGKALITDERGSILLLKVNQAELSDNAHGEYWDLPGRRIHKGKTVEETLKREVGDFCPTPLMSCWA